MLSILEKIRKPANSAADLRARLAEVEMELPTVEAKVRAAEALRAAGLLDLDDHQLERIEADLRLAVRDRARARAARDELERRAAEAEQAEAKAALDAERAAVEARAAKIAGRLRREYAEHGAAIAALLSELVEAEEAVRLVNRRLGEAGRDDVLARVEERAIPAGQFSASAVSVTVLTSLRPLGDCVGWGGGKRAAADLGLRT